MNKKTKILFIIFMTLILIFVVFYFWESRKTKTIIEKNPTSIKTIEEPKSLTEDEQLDILNQLQEQDSDNNTSNEEQLKILETLQKNNNTTNSLDEESPDGTNNSNLQKEKPKTISKEEQLKILESLQN